MIRKPQILFVLLAACLFAAACGDDAPPVDSGNPDSGGTDSGGGDSMTPMDSGTDSMTPTDSGMTDGDIADAPIDTAPDALPPDSTVVARLSASDGVAADYFGVAVSIDGDTVIVGAHFRDGATGAVYVYVRSGDTWTEEATLLATDGATQDFFGSSVAIQGDTAIIGALGDDTGGASAGSVYVFVRAGTTWTQDTKLSASDPRTLNRFGSSVAISGDTVLVGAFANDDNGGAYMFERTGASWSAAVKLVHDGPMNGRFGRSVAIDRDTAIVGASVARRAYVYARGPTGWVQEATLQSDGGGNSLGRAVAILGDTAIVGSPEEGNVNGFRAGAAYVFVRSGTSWSQQQQLLGGVDTGGARFGDAIAIAGERVLIGALGEGPMINGTGAAYLFERTDTTWTRIARLMASDASARAFFGISVSFSGNFMAIGASGADAAYVVPLGSL